MYNYRAAHPESQSVPPLPESESSQPEWSWAFSFPKSLFLPGLNRRWHFWSVFSSAETSWSPGCRWFSGKWCVSRCHPFSPPVRAFQAVPLSDSGLPNPPGSLSPSATPPLPRISGCGKGKNRKPLIIQGARQAGKTWLMKEFGQKVYQDYIYINFDSNSRMSELFSSDLNPQRLILGLELYSGKKTFPRTLSSFSMKSGRFQEPFPAWSILRECTSIPYHQCRISPWNRASPRHFFSGRKNRFSKAVPSFLSGISDDSGTGTICWSSIIL